MNENNARAKRLVSIVIPVLLLVTGQLALAGAPQPLPGP